MISLTDHDQARTKLWILAEREESRPTGIACPACGNEIFDSHPGRMLQTNPPRFEAHCPACQWHGTRVA